MALYGLISYGAHNFEIIFPLQTFLLDHAVLRRKFKNLRERCCPSLKFQYSAIEEEIITTPHWPPIGPHAVISSPSGPDFYTPDEFAKETDRMLPDSVDFNHSSLSSSPTAGHTPKSSTSENPYFSSATLNSSHKQSLASVGDMPYTQSTELPPDDQHSCEASSSKLVTNTHGKAEPEKIVLDQDIDITAQNYFGLHDKSPCPV